LQLEGDYTLMDDLIVGRTIDPTNIKFG